MKASRLYQWPESLRSIRDPNCQCLQGDSIRNTVCDAYRLHRKYIPCILKPKSISSNFSQLQQPKTKGAPVYALTKSPAARHFPFSYLESITRAMWDPMLCRNKPRILLQRLSSDVDHYSITTAIDVPRSSSWLILCLYDSRDIRAPFSQYRAATLI